MLVRRPVCSRPQRRGAALVELAVCLPMMLIITLGAIETANAIFLKQCLTSIAYEGARLASGPGGTTADAQTLCQQLLTARKINGATVSCTSITASAAAGTPITVQVTATVDNNSIGISKYFKSRSLSASATMARM